jgi:hypothetical protein
MTASQSSFGLRFATHGAAPQSGSRPKKKSATLSPSVSTAVSELP